MAKKKTVKPVDMSKWEDDNFLNAASVLKQGKTEGVAIRTAKKYKDRPLSWRKSFWIQKDQDIDGVLEWFFYTVKGFFSKFWGKEIISKDDLEAKERLVVDLRDQLRTREIELDELKDSFDLQQKELKLAHELIDKADKYEEILNKFEDKIKKSIENDTRIEEEIKRDLKEHKWILGLDCEVKAKNKAIDPQTAIDLHIVTNFEEDRVFEVKSPNIPIFSKNTKKRYNISSDISNGLSEIVEYLQRTDTYSKIVQRGVYGIERPIGRLLAGYNLTRDQERLLKDWNFHLQPAIKIITFKSLIENARKEIKIIKYVRKQKTKTK